MKTVPFGTRGETAQVVLEMGDSGRGLIVCTEVVEMIDGRPVRRAHRYWALHEEDALRVYDETDAAVVEQRIEAKRSADARGESLKVVAAETRG